jgi:hypothetical protein
MPTISVTCSSCKKPFSFDTATTSKGTTQTFAEKSESKEVIYYPTCTNCNKMNIVRR